MKMNFTTPTMEINRFSAENIVATSAVSVENTIKGSESFKNISSDKIKTVEMNAINWTY